MSAINPRASGFWASSRMSYISVSDSYDDDAASDIDLEGMAFQLAEDDGRTPLDRTIDRIGMGEPPLFFQAEETLGSHSHGTFRELSMDAPLSMWVW